MELWITGITYVYFLLNAIRVFFYVPQILAIINDKSSAKAISLVMWIFWAKVNFITGLYGTFVLKDLFLSMVSYGSTIGCLAVVAIVFYKRRKYALEVEDYEAFATNEDVLKTLNAKY
jgi:uncharacterized protein with PQ loop repeat